MRSARYIAALVACCAVVWPSVATAQEVTTTIPVETTTPPDTEPVETSTVPESTAPPETAPPETSPPATSPPATRAPQPQEVAPVVEETTTTEVEASSTTNAPSTTAAAVSDEELVGGGVIVNGDGDNADEIEARVKDPAEERLEQITWGLIGLAVVIFVGTVLFWWRTRPSRVAADTDPWDLVVAEQAVENGSTTPAVDDPDATLADNPAVAAATSGAAVAATAGATAAPTPPLSPAPTPPLSPAPTLPPEPTPAPATAGSTRDANPLFAALAGIPDLERSAAPTPPDPTDEDPPQ